MQGSIVREMPINAGERKTAWSFLISAGTTLMIGLGLAVSAMLCFRPAKEIVEVVKTVRVAAPAPPQKIVTQVVEKLVEKKVPLYLPYSPPPKPVPKGLFGIWRPRSSALPMFNIRNEGGTVAGTYASATGAVLHFTGGKVDGDTVEFVVDDKLLRQHFRLKQYLSASSMTCETFITDADWLLSLERAKEQSTSPQKELELRAILMESAKLTRAPLLLPTLYRGTED